jgi:predicted CxxxxCH...CXXCH cytochrome family protein
MTSPFATRTMRHGTFLGAFARSGSAFLLLLAALSMLGGCVPPELPAPTLTYLEVEPLLTAKCASCHSGAAPAGGYRVDTYVGSISCPTDAGSAVALPVADAPILTALATPTHTDLLTIEETALLTAWVEAGAPANVGAMHAAGWADPRSPAFHGSALAADVPRFNRMFEPATAEDACGRCHAGSPGATEPLAHPAPRATACTSCHREEGGPVACTTCHGSPGKSYPPRDLCLITDPTEHARQVAAGGAHAKHLAQGFQCTLCHGVERTAAQLRDPAPPSLHANGTVEVVLDTTDPRVGVDGGYDVATGACTVRCHNPEADARPPPTWGTVGELGCDSCHSSPPATHAAWDSTGCDRCHSEAAPDGLSRRVGPLHANGTVDVGNGAVLADGITPACNACHGAGDPNGMPSTGSHASHVHSTLTAGITCSDCHAVPAVWSDAGHLDLTPGVDVRFLPTDRASARDAAPHYDPATGTCSGVACHGNGTNPALPGGTFRTPIWGATDGLAARCGACHSAPPPAPHTALPTCSSLTCHGGELAVGVGGPTITEAGRALHINGTVQLWLP